MRKLILAALLAAPMFASAAGANLITNGDFETFSGSFSNNFSLVNAGSGALAGWTIGGTSIDVINGAYGAIAGNSIDMLGSPGPGSLEQTFATVIGQTYVLSFDLSANTGGDNDSVGKALNVFVNGGLSSLYTGTPTITSESFSFIANAASTTLMFASGASGSSGAVLDNVSVAAVPEPETYAMMLAGLMMMGTIARRRNKKQG